MRMVDSLAALNFLLHAIERLHMLDIASSGLRGSSLPDHARPASLGNQYIALRLRFFELLFELAQSGLQILDLDLLIGNLLLEVLRSLLRAERALDRGPREIVLLLRNSELRLARPLGCFLEVFFLLLLQKVLIGDR